MEPSTSHAHTHKGTSEGNKSQLGVFNFLAFHLMRTYFSIWSERKKCKTKSVSWCQPTQYRKTQEKKNQNVEATTTATTTHSHIDHFFIVRIHLRRLNVYWNFVCDSTGWCCCSSQIPTSITTRPYAPNAHTIYLLLFCCLFLVAFCWFRFAYIYQFVSSLRAWRIQYLLSAHVFSAIKIDVVVSPRFFFDTWQPPHIRSYLQHDNFLCCCCRCCVLFTFHLIVHFHLCWINLQAIPAVEMEKIRPYADVCALRTIDMNSDTQTALFSLISFPVKPLNYGFPENENNNVKTHQMPSM